MNYIAFDFDGTLADTQFAICEAMERACIRQGITYIGDEELTKHIGQDLDFCIRHATDSQLTQKQIEQLTRSYRETFRFNLIQMFSGMRRVIELCDDMGDKIAIATSRHSNSLNILMEMFELENLIDVTVPGDKVENPKPNPEMLVKVSQEFGCKEQEIIMVGDSIWDMEMAKSCNAFAIGVTWGTNNEAQLRESGADVVCKTPLELANHFNFAAV